MLAHNNGQTINFSAFGKSLGVSHTSIKNYVDLLESTFMVDSIGPYISNMGKRLVKAPKVYVCDSGLTASLLGLEGFDQLAGHPAFGSLWEQIVLTNLRSNFPEAEFFYYRTSNGAEIDFVMKWKDKILTVECKSTKSPVFSRGNHAAIEDIKPEQTYVVAPIFDSWILSKNIKVVSLLHLITNIRENYS